MRFDVPKQLVHALNHHPTFSREEELEVSRKARKGSQRDIDRMVKHNIGLVLVICKPWIAQYPMHSDDIMQEGFFGLLKAIEKYEPDRGIKFSTYAAWWIRAYLQRFIFEYGTTIRSVRATKTLPAGTATVFSLDAPVKDDSDDTFLDLLEDESPSIEEGMLQQSRVLAVRKALKKLRLKPVAKDILKNRIMGDEPDTLTTIGNRHKLSGERVRQLEQELKEKISEVLKV